MVAGTNSVVIAGNGNDKVTAGAGSVIVVGNGNDTVTDGADSVIVAGNGNDTVSVGSGNNSITLLLIAHRLRTASSRSTAAV